MRKIYDYHDQLPIDIFLITYNRKDNLKDTLSKILSVDSPIRNNKITVLDNHSSDDTEKIVKIYQASHSNIVYHKQKRNIGGNANILDCFRLSSNIYFWILCDDDEYNWNGWGEIVKAINKKYDCIMTKRLTQSRIIPEYILVNELTFVPGAIYKTSLVTSDVIQCGYYNLFTSFPHFSLIAKIINEERKIYIPEQPIVAQGCKNGDAFTRGTRASRHFIQEHSNLFLGYVLSFNLIKDKKIRYEAFDHLVLGRSFLYSYLLFFKQNKNYIPNLIIFFLPLNIRQKICYLICLLYYYFIPKFQKKGKMIYCKYLSIKFRIW